MRPIEQSDEYFERVLTVEGLPETKVNRIKLVVKQLFESRACQYLCPPVLNPPDYNRLAEISPDDLNPDFLIQAQQFIGFVQTKTKPKELEGFTVSGSVIGTMLSRLAIKINKKRAPNLSAAFKLAIATESRRCKESLLLSFYEEMTAIERKLPMDDDELTSLHENKSLKVLSEYDQRIEFVLSSATVQEERKNLQQRVTDYLKDLRTNNYNHSLEHCKATFHRIFDSVLEAKDKSPAELDRMLLDSIDEYQNSAVGPCADLVMSDNISVIASFCTQALRQADIQHQTETEVLKAEVCRLTSALASSKEAEEILHALVDEVTEKAAVTIEAKNAQLALLAASVETRVCIAEAKLRDVKREHQSMAIELEQAKKEKLLLAETQSEIHGKHLEEAEQRLSKTLALNARLTQQLEDLRNDLEHTMAEKNTQINELSRKIKQFESQTDSSPRKDTLIVMAIKDYIEGIKTNFTNDQLSRKKAVHYMEQLSVVQGDLNKIRLDEQSQRLRLSEDYETNKSSLRTQLEASDKHSARLEQLCTSLQEILNKRRNEQEVPERTEDSEEKPEDLEHGQGMNDLLEVHLKVQLELSESQRKTIEQLRNEIDEKVELISKLKYDVVAMEDDIDMLIQAINSICEFTKKLRPSLRGAFKAMHNPDHKSKVEQLLTRHQIPFS